MADTFTRTISGRDVEFKPPTDAQALMVGRLLRTSRTFIDNEDQDIAVVRGGVEKLSMILDILDSMVIHASDRDWLESKIIDGSLDMAELMGALNADQEPPPANRAQKRVAAKKTTSRARRS